MSNLEPHVGILTRMELSLAAESWPISVIFALSRGSKAEAEVIVATIRDGEYEGRGECVPYKRYGETIESVKAQIESARSEVEKGLSRTELQKILPPGAARNALDCALWDLEAKQKGRSIWELLNIKPEPKQTAFTISLHTPGKMAEEASVAAKEYSLLKIKLGAGGDEVRLKKIREAAPHARLIVDVNEGWDENNIGGMIQACESVGVELIEQPVSVEHSNILQNVRTPILICADESAHTSGDIPKLVGYYSAVNIKLDKAGGLTEALAMVKKAKEAGLAIMVGCNVSTSLSMAPATVLAQYADYVDLDGPLLLERDREPSIEYREGMIMPTVSEIWG